MPYNEVIYHITTPEPGPENRQDKPVIYMSNGILRIEDCQLRHITLTVNQAKALAGLLPAMIPMLEAYCYGDGEFKFGSLP